MRHAALLTSAVLLAAGAPATAHAAAGHGPGHGSEEPAAPIGTHSVAIVNSAFSPAGVTALTGDTVEWRNQDLMVHNVSASSGAFQSASLHRGERFAHRFEIAGSYAFRCTLHPSMTGRVDVHPLLLEAASSSVVAGQPVELHGRGPAAGPVTIEQQVAGADSFTPVASVSADSAGRFHGTVKPESDTTYRAVGDRGASPAVTVAVATRLRVALAVKRRGRVTRVRVAAPGAAGATAKLQLYSRERFTWLDRRRVRLDAAGRAAFDLRARLRYHARVVVVSASGGVVATSGSVKLPR